MAYNEELDARIGEAVSDWGATRKKMFGGTCFLLNGNMMCGVHRDSLILRLGQGQAEVALEYPFARPFDITGRPMKGWVMINDKGYADAALTEWLEQARTFAASLPAK